MKKYIISLFLVAFLLAPIFSFAQEEDIDPNPTGSECVVIVNNLKYKSRDANTNGEVSTLQDFLQSKGYVNIEPTGYFGILTLKGVKDFQRANNFAQTGFVGPVTRAKIKALTCGEVVPIDTNVCCEMFGYGSYMVKTPSVYEIMPKSKCASGLTVGGGRNIVDGSFCKINSNNPVISGVSGPQTLNVNQTGTWKVSAYDRNGGNLSYSVNWGEENNRIMAPTSQFDRLEKSQSATFTHSYSQAGTYTAVFTVTNNSNVVCVTYPCGGSATTSLTIKVGQAELTPSITILSPNGGETYTSGQQARVSWRSIKSQTNAVATLVLLDGNKNLVKNLIELPRVTIPDSGSWNVTFDSSIPNGSYYIKICQMEGGCDISDSLFKIYSSNSIAPVISGISGPQTLNANQTGTWTISAYDRNGGNLSYSVNWGDAIYTCPTGSACAKTMSVSQQSATFIHSYSQAGTYVPTFMVTNSSGQSATSSLSVKVGGTIINTYPQIISTIGNQSNYSANSEIEFVVKTANGVGGIATIGEGFAVQAYVFPASDPTFQGNYLTPNPANSYNASFSDGYWKVKMNAPTVPGSYNLRVVLYCSNPTMCSNAIQDVEVLPFTVNSTVATNDILTVKNINLSNQTVNQNSFGTKIGSYIVTNNSSEPVKLTNLTVSMYGETSIPVSVLSNLVVKNNSTILASSNSPTNLNNFSSDLIVSAGFYKQIDIYADIGVTSSGKIQTLLGVNGQGINTGNSFPLTPRESTYGQVITVQ